jgi:two-component system phosphate regulon sensor histidine kinase PhoR
MDFRNIVDEVTKVMQINADSKEIALITNLPEKPLTLWGDRDKLYRVVYNLVGNAIKYTSRNGRVEVQSIKENDQIVLHVIDDGYGMTEDQIAQLFQLYYRTEDARKSKTQGTGLGLYIVKMLVEAHKGDISVTSQPEIGSTFSVTLPCQPQIDV